MRFRELERIILDDGWVLSDIRGDIPLRVVNSTGWTKIIWNSL